MRSISALAVAVALLSAAPSEAAVVRLGIGADYLVNDTGEFNLTIAVGTHVARLIQVGARFGALVASSPNFFGVPVDLFARANLADARVYIELLAGPWFYFVNPDPVHAHVAFGFGLHAGPVSFGLEAGYVTNDAIIGIRIAFALY